jgi:hypothetical protein
MPSIKANLIIALAIGVLISTTLFVMESLTDHSTLSLEWQMPGISAAFLFWGAIGDSGFFGVAVAWAVNAIVYGAVAFAVLIFLRLLTLARPEVS